VSTPTAPAGWYDDGQHPGQQRYWDGEQWTEHFHPPVINQQPAPPAPGTAGSRPRRYWAWLAPLLVVVVAGATLGGLALGGVFGGDSPTNAINQLIAGTNERDCDKILAATTTTLGESMRDYYCGALDEDSYEGTVAFQPTQTFATERGATVLGILVQTGRDSTNSNCFAIATVFERGRWRVEMLGSDAFPADVELDSSAPGYCTGTPGLTE